MSYGDGTIPEGSIVATDAGGALVLRRGVVRVVDGADRGVEVPLGAATVIVGSSPSADLVLADRRASRQHLEIALVPRGVRLRDLRSRNGTFVGEARVESLVVPFGTRVRVGRTTLELEAADAPLSTTPASEPRFGSLLGASVPMRRMFATLARVAPTEAPVLIHGEPGVGKTVAALALHEASGRTGPMLVIDGPAVRDRGPIEEALASASQGTLLVEDVDRLSADGARALEAALDTAERGGTAEREGTAPRLISTARDDPRGLVERGAFSRDLYFRVATVRVEVPPLRERPEDVALLVERFRGDGPPPAAAELDALRAGGFPGNVRALRAIAAAAAGPSPGVEPGPADEDFKAQKQRVVDAFEREFVERLLAEHDGNVSAAARAAGMARSHLISLIEKHGL